MDKHVRVEIVPRTVDADEGTRAGRGETVEKLANLGLVEDPASGEVGGQATVGYTVTVGASVLEVAGYAVEPGDDGRAVVSLLLSADAVQIGTVPAQAAPQPTTVAAPAKDARRAVWGQANTPDPRVDIPGWSPGGATVEFAASSTGDGLVDALRASIQDRFGGDGRTALGQ
jgi:hypothetical protein